MWSFQGPLEGDFLHVQLPGANQSSWHKSECPMSHRRVPLNLKLGRSLGDAATAAILPAKPQVKVDEGLRHAGCPEALPCTIQAGETPMGSHAGYASLQLSRSLAIAFLQDAHRTPMLSGRELPSPHPTPHSSASPFIKSTASRSLVWDSLTGVPPRAAQWPQGGRVGAEPRRVQTSGGHGSGMTSDGSYVH